MRNVSGNFLIMQDYTFDRELQFAQSWFKGPLKFVTFQMPETQEHVSLSWHLTEKEKKLLKSASENKENKQALEELKSVLKPEINNPLIVSEQQRSGLLVKNSTLK
jgi:hypothetical protein